jgi:hypothetical protein
VGIAKDLPNGPYITRYYLDQSPIDFVLVGPSGNHRRAIVRSIGKNMDLVAMDQKRSPGEEVFTSISFFDFLSYYLLRANPFNRYVVRSDQWNIIDEDHRTSYYSFAWRGLASESNIPHIEKLLNEISVDIAMALKTRREDDIEWLMAPIILSCQRATERRLRERAMFRLLSIGIGILLLVAILEPVLKRLPT